MAAPPSRPQRTTPDPWLAAGLFLLCGVVWSVVVPPFESPDETGHARYVNFLAAERRLPIDEHVARGESHQPPLYYALAAVVATAAGLPAIPVSPQRNSAFRWYGGSEENKYIHAPEEQPPLAGTHRTLHWLRILSVLFAAGTVLLVYRLARLVLDPAGSLIAAACAASLPQFTFIAASLNNDNLANLLCTAAMLAIASAVESRGTRTWGLAGGLTGVAVLAKFTGLVLYPCAALALWVAHRPLRRAAVPSPRGLLRAAASFLVPALLIPMPLLVRNARVFGDPLGAGIQEILLPNLADPKPLLSGYFLREFPVVLFESFWGRFGWMSLPLPAACYLAAGVVVIACLAGIGLMVWSRELGPVHRLFLAAIGIQFVQVVAFNLSFTQAQGRFLFPVIGPIAVMGCAGILRFAHAIGVPPPGAPQARYAVMMLAAANLAVAQLLVAPAY